MCILYSTRLPRLVAHACLWHARQETPVHVLGLGKVESQQVQALVVQQLELGGELLLLEANDPTPRLDDEDHAPAADHLLWSLHERHSKICHMRVT